MNKIGVIYMVLPGRTLMDEEECKERKAFEHFTVNVKDSTSTETLHIATRTCRPAVKRIHITDIMLREWLGVDENKNIDNYIRKYATSANEMINLQVKKLVESMGGSDYSYKIFE